MVPGGYQRELDRKRGLSLRRVIWVTALPAVVHEHFAIIPPDEADRAFVSIGKNDAADVTGLHPIVVSGDLAH